MNYANHNKFNSVANVASILGLILALSSVFFSPQKRPFYSIKTHNIIDDYISNIEKLDIKYRSSCNKNLEEKKCKSEKISSLSKSRILFWNGGRKKIDQTDIDDNPITIVASENNSILNVKIIHVSNDKTNLRVNSENNTILFDFLGKGHGGVIDVLHTGSSDEDINLETYVEDSKFNGNIKKYVPQINI